MSSENPHVSSGAEPHAPTPPQAPTNNRSARAPATPGPHSPSEQDAPADPGRRFSVLDRRSGIDRRDIPAALRKQGESDPPSTGLERRRGPGRRRTDFTKAAEEGEMTSEQFLFVMAIDAFKRANNKSFPTWTDVLEVIRLLGYRKTMPSELKLTSAEDWRENPDAPARVRTTPGHPEPARDAA